MSTILKKPFTDTEKLNALIDASGLKKAHIAKLLGIKPCTLSRKIGNKSDFKGSEMEALCDLLGIKTREEREAIFFASEVAKTATRKE